MKKYFIDLFAGAGGLAEGFVASGFLPLAHVEMNKEACNSLITRLGYHYLKSKNKLEIYYKYLKKEISREEFLAHIDKKVISSVINETISDETIDKIFSTIDNNIKNQKASVEVIIGGPPCQAYSIVGRSVQGERVSKDKRNWLFKLYLRFLDRYKPSVFVFENVTGLLSAAGGKYYIELFDGLQKAGYHVESRTLTSSDYGVIQNIRRVIILGIKNGMPIKDIYPLPNKIANKYFVNDLFSDLPSLTNTNSCFQYAGPITKYCLKTGIRTEDDVLTWHTKRINNERDREIYKTAIRIWNEKQSRLNYNSLPKQLKTHKNTKAFVDRFKVVAGNLHCSQTILAHLAKDGHYFIHPDIKQCRSISVREAARLQSFPDSYYFEGSRGAAFTQIGNAVPPLLSKAIAERIMSYFKEI